MGYLMSPPSLSAALLALLVLASASAGAQSFALSGSRSAGDATASRSGSPIVFDSGPVTLEIERGAHSFYFTAPNPQIAAERGSFAGERSNSRLPGQPAAHAAPADSSFGWRYRSNFLHDRGVSLSYNAQIAFDAGDGDITSSRASGEYLVRVEVARDVGRFTPRAEIGYRYLPRSPYEMQSGRSAYTSVGASYRYSDRSTLDLYLDYEIPSVSGVPAQRNAGFNFAHRVSSGTQLAFHAFRSVSEDKAYNAGVSVSVQF